MKDEGLKCGGNLTHFIAPLDTALITFIMFHRSNPLPLRKKTKFISSGVKYSVTCRPKPEVQKR